MNQGNKDRFTPIRGTESQILASEPVKGYVWFATDTKKIYYSDGMNFISMGGNSSIYYGKMVLAETPDEEQTIFEFAFEDIDGNEEGSEDYIIPNIDDLILNIPDGCFYRVLSIADNSIQARKLTIAGSGTGGSGGGGSVQTGNAKIKKASEKTIVSLYKKECLIEFNFSAIDSDGESTGNAPAYVTINNEKVMDLMVEQGDNTIDVGPYISNLGENTVYIYVNADIGSGQSLLVSKLWKVQTVLVNLTWDYDETIINYINRPLVLNWEVSGNIEKTTHMIINDSYHLTFGPTKQTAGWGKTFQPADFEAYNMGHGAHKIEMYVTININGTEVQTDSIYKYIMIVDVDSTIPIISCNFTNTELIQYDTVQIPIIIYNKTGSSKVQLRENNVLKDTWNNILNGVVYNWSYTPVESGEQALLISCNESECRLRFNVESLDIDSNESEGYAFKFKATDFSSNIALQNWTSNDVTATFSDNFDWINGGIKTELDENNNVRQFVCIKAGTSMTINYQAFNESANRNGKAIKVIFKATRCRDFDAQVLKCYDDDTNIGLLMRAQDVVFNSEQSSIRTQYCEDSYIEFETDIWPNPKNPVIVNGMDVSQRYIMTWMDGVPSGVSVYASNDSFRNEESITIGSDDCDVQIYLIKVYERHLNNEEHLANFIADAPNAGEILSRFKRNDILDDRGEISPTKLAKANPDCLVHLYEVDHVSTHKKKDVVNGCSYTQYHGSDQAVMTAQNVTMKVQGTSSARYGVAAFNLDSKFNDGFDLADGTHIKKWAMTEDAIPVNYFTTKVNVASCEQANNALNQEYYNRFQPYICKYRRKNPKARDTMQFTPGVMFILDHNQNTDLTERDKNNVFKDTVGYVQEPYFKLYSVCNMGNSKKNTEVFHDEENPFECCVEVTDNQTRGQWMTEVPAYIQEQGKDEPTYVGEITNGDVEIHYENGDVTGISIVGLTPEEYAQWDLACSDAAFEFRHPDGEGTEDHKAAFFRLLRWMSMNDVSAKYEEIEIANEADFNKKVNGYFADEANQRDWVDPVVLYTEHAASVGVTHEVAAAYTEGEQYYIVSSHPHGYTNEALPQPQSFDAYTFKNTEFTQKLKGLTISTYAGTYTTDCYEYRMAKMLSECENYLIMDAVVFHFLFIERHTLIDNVAKNTFWSTEDLIHWGPLKDYDNDTSDGNDNQGKLSLSYGYEALDPIADKFVFNAHQAVWLNFINGIQPACSTMYIALNSVNTTYGSNAWDPEPYLKMFKDWQDCVPERCWIECYYRLYLRPREVYGASEYIDMLEGGKKTHQRKQFETYQNYYIASKYTVSSETVMIRGNGSNLLNYSIPVTVYSDCYIKTEWGQQHFNKRVKRREVNNIICPIDSVNNATVYFYFPSLYQTIGDLSGILPEQFDSSAAIRLRELTLGGDNAINNTLKNANFAGNTQLEKLVVKNCPGISMPLDLSGATALKELDARNSSFTGITIADGAPLQKLYVESPSSLTLTNLKFVNDFRIASYDNISTLYIDNIDLSPGINSKALVNSSPNLHFYGLRNVNWLMNSPTEIDNVEKTINILERLKTLGRKDIYGNDLDQAVALTGNLEVTSDAYNTDDSFDIYDKYAQVDVYPNLDIYFSGDTAKLYSVKVYDGNNDICWTRKIVQGGDINEDFLSTGPLGAFSVDTVRKSETESTTFEFSGKWEVYDGEGNPILVGEDVLDEASPSFTNVESDLVFIPVFIDHIRQYRVKFYNGTEDLNPTDYIFNYGTRLGDITPKAIPYKDDSGLDLETTNAFIGYAINELSTTPANENMLITDSYEFYALFREKSVYENALDERYINFIKKADGTYRISAKSGVTYAGKITLPIVNPEDGGLVTSISDGGFQNQTNLKYVFWERKNGVTNGVTSVGATAFSQDISLLYFEMSPSITTIGNQAFQNCNKLFTESTQAQVTAFFKNITSIGQRAFMMAGYNDNSGVNTTLMLSESLSVLGQAAFGTSGFRHIQIGDTNKPSVLKSFGCGNQIFSNSMIETLSFTAYINPADQQDWVNLQSNFGLVLGSGGTITYIDAFSGDDVYNF